MRDKRILWAINCYSRVNHLRAQVELVRKQFGSFFEVLVYTNHQDLRRFPDSSFDRGADVFYRHDVNTGGHTGCRDAYNHVVELSRVFDYVVWSHADFLVRDYSRVEGWIDRMVADGSVFMCLGKTQQQNPRRPHEGIVPHIYNDFFVLESGFYREVFPQHEVCDGWLPSGEITDCIEVALGKWVAAKIGSRSTTVIPCKLERGTADGYIDGTDWVGTRDDEFSKAMLFLAEHDRPSYVHLMTKDMTVGWLDDRR